MKLISLCLITGNCEEYIERCLTSFAPIADEIIVVRAIGNQKPDRTLDIAREKFDAITGEYLNQPQHSDWPHVDNFAAARNISYSLATGKYCFWCDTDDILKSGAEIIRELAERAEYPVYLFPYDIFGRGVVVPRERMMLRDSGKWIYPVHECYTFPIKVEGCQDDRVVVQHLPHMTKSGGNQRNLRILESIPEADRKPGTLYHLHGELVAAGRTQEAVSMAIKAIESDIGAPEKYELWMNLARMATTPTAKHKYLIQAYGVDPKRREALGLLVSNSLDLGLRKEALAFARQMMATEQPEDQSWNDRAAAYGWLGVDLYTQALRANGLINEAERIRNGYLDKMGGPLIALVHATRGRPYQASVARKLWQDLADCPERVEHIFVFDEDDHESLPLCRMNHLIVPAGGGCVNAWNQGVMATRAPVIVQLSDDWIPCPKWDSIILERLGDITQPSVLAVSDGLRDDQLLCMAICTRTYWAQDHYLFHPDFTGVYSDNFFTKVAYDRKQVIEARDIVFTHNHYLKTGEAPDQTYKNQNAQARYDEGQQIFQRLTQGEIRDWSTVPGWFNYWPFYGHVARNLKDGDQVAEVGTWLGRSLIFLAQECKRLGKRVRFYAVDTFAGEALQPEHQELVQQHGGSIRAEFERNIRECGVADMITILQGDSAAMAECIEDGSLAFCYIDAAHEYEPVKRDILAWKDKVRSGGLLAGHDIQHEPVRKAVMELLPSAQHSYPIWVQSVTRPTGKEVA